MNQSTIQLTEPTPETTSSDQIILAAAKGGGIAFIGNLFSYGIQFAFGIVIARLLGADLLGLYSLGMTFPELAGFIAVLGLGVGIARFIPIAINQRDEARLRGIFQVGIALPGVVSMVLALGIFLSADLISVRIYNQPDLAPVVRLGCLAIPLFALMAVLEAVTQGFKRMEYKVYSEDITLSVSKLVLTVVLVGAGLGVMGAVGANIVALVATVVMLFVFVNHLFPLAHVWQAAKRDIRGLFRFSLPIYLSMLVGQFGSKIATLVLGFFGTFSGIGIYVAASRVAGVGYLFYWSLMRIAMPMVADLHSRGKIDQLERMYQTMTKWGMIFNLPVFFSMAIFARPLLSIFGPDFVAGASSLIILAFAVLFDVSTGVCGTIVTMTGHSKLSLANSVISLVVSVGLHLLLIPRWGLVGAAVASVFCAVLINVLRLVEVYLLFKIQPYNRSILKPLFAALAAAAVAFMANQWLGILPSILQLIIGAALLCAVYAGIIVLLKLDDEDRLILKRVWARLSSRKADSE
jgi:O-antigen/teichoic acid export membrane protein